MNRFMRKKHIHLSARTLQISALGTLCAIGAFAAGIETAGDVHPFARSEAALQEIVADDTQIPGDVNGNGRLDAGDAFLLSQHIDGLLDLTVEQTSRADVDGDLRVTTDDLRRVLYTLSLR